MSVKIIARKGTASQIESAASSVQEQGEIAFATDTKDFYVSDGTQFNKIGKDQLSQFSEISVASNIDTWHLSDTNRLDLSPPEANPTGITFKPDGTKAFVLGYSRNRVQMYDLSTAWDLTSAGSPTESEYLVQGGLSSTQEDFFIDSSGTRMYVLSRSSDSVGQFTLNTAWDISDITFVQDVHMNSTSLSGGVAGFATGESNPMGMTFKPDGTIMYLVGYSLDEVFQIPLSTAWDISTHGTITSLDVSIESTPNAVQFNNDGTVMYIMGYSTDAILQYNLSTAWDVTTASFVKRTTAFIRPLEGTGSGFYYNETEQKAFVCGRASDFAYEVIISEALRFSDPVSAEVLQGDRVIANELMTGYTGKNDFFNSIYSHSHFQTFSTAYLGYNSGAQNVRVGNTVYGNFRFHVFQGNYMDANFISNPTGALPNIRFFNPYIGGVGVFSIGKTHNTNTTYLLGGITDIESEADTFDHKGEITLGGELKVTGNQPLKYKDPNLYTQGTQIVLDNFTESTQTTLDNHTPDTGNGYTNVYISNSISFPTHLPIIEANNGFLRPAVNNSNDGYRFVNDTTISTTNYEARAVIRKQSSSDDPFVLFVKYIDEDNYFAMHFAANYSYCTPISVVAGTYTQHGALYYYANTSTADDVNFEVALRVVGNNVHLFYEGRYRGSREVNITGIGKAGIGFGKSNNSILTGYDLTTNAQISKFEIYELPDSLFDGSDSVHYIENGKVGIGTTSPTSTLDIEDASGVTIDINSSTGDGQFRFQDNAVTKWSIGRDNTQQNFVFSNSAGLSNNNVLVLTHTDGNVGIGTTSPSHKLDVSGDVHLNNLQLSDFAGDIYFGVNSANNKFSYNQWLASASGGMVIKNTANASTGHIAFETSTGEALRIIRDGNVGIGTTSPDVELEVEGTIKASTHGDGLVLGSPTTPKHKLGVYGANDLLFKAPNNTVTMVITADAKIGIGTTSPAYKLHVNGTARFEDAITLSDDVNNRIDADATGLLFKSAAHYTFSKGANTLMFIKETGNVGIGTTSPAHKLDVNGEVKSDAYRIDLSATTQRAISSTGTDSIQVGDAGVNDIKFKNASGNSVVITSTGNVGIGTTSPARLLHVDGSSGARISYESANMDLFYYGIEFNRQSNYLRPTTNSGKSLYIGSGSQNYTWGTVYLDAAVVQFRNSSSEPLMRFDSSTGRLGIGTTSSSEKLHIGGGGNIRVDGSEIYITQASSSRKPVRLHQASYKGAITLQRDGVDNVHISSDQPQHGHTYFNGDGVNVGIGTTSPSEKLEVSDNIKAARVVSDILRDTNNNSHLQTAVTNASNTATVVGNSATANTLTLGVKSAGNVVVPNGNVGIGTTSPVAELHVNGSGATGYLHLTNSTSGSTINDGMTVGVNASNYFIYVREASPLYFATNATERMRITSAGNVGIGTSAPTEKLHVEGTSKFVGQGTWPMKMENNVSSGTAEMGLWTVTDVYAQNEQFSLVATPHPNISSRPIWYFQASGDGWRDMTLQRYGGRVGIRTLNPSANLTVQGGGTTTGKTFLAQDSNASALFTILDSGNVGIGTTSPSEKLDVVGNIKASGTIKGKMEQMFACSFSDDLGTTKHFIPFTSNAEQINVHADHVAMVMPYGGRVKCIQMRLSNIDADTTRTLGIESIATGVNMFQNAGNWTVEETEAYELVASDDYYLVNYVFSNETHFDSGDLLAISIQDSEDAHTASRQIYMNVIIEYDLNNGMGNDTATTKYTS